jgi:glycosyltransferase involved in cell wall biosynthesis
MSKRLLFITPGLGKGGAETQLVKIAKFFRKNDMDVMILALKPIDNFSDLKESDIKIVFLKDWKRNMVSNISMLYNTIKSYKPEVVLAFMFISIIVARLFKWRFNYKLVSSVRNSVIGDKWRLIFKLTSRFDDVVVYNANASKLNFEQNNMAQHNGIVINNAITVPIIKDIPEISKKSPFVWVSMAHFRPSKDYQTLFDAIPLIKNEDFRVDILGHMYQLAWPQQKINDLKIADKVRLLGFKNNSEYYLQQADALVLSSFNEGMPNAILEAMAYSKPIVASEIDGIKELLTACDCGFLFHQGSAQDLADKMDRVMAMSVSERSQLSSRGREYVIKHFAEEVVLNKWLEVVNTFFIPRDVTSEIIST